MDFSNYIFRSHMVGKIIDVPKPLTENQKSTLSDLELRYKGNGKPLTESLKKTYYSLVTKNEESQKIKLSDSSKKVLSEIVFAETFKREVVLNSKQIDKGIEKEKEARDLLSRVTGLFLTECKERKSNSWVTGLIDIKPDNGVIIDIKSSWSWQSFCKILQEKYNFIYERQTDSYMDLWGLNESIICHVLIDTPFHLIESEIKRLDYNLNILDLEGNIKNDYIPEVKKIVLNHIFSEKALNEFCQMSPIVYKEWFKDFVEVPEDKRVHMFYNPFSKERIEQRNEAIRLSRVYMNKCKPLNNFQKEICVNV